jgi:hypothetical protein
MKLRDLVDDLRLIDRECQIIIHENEFLPFGQIANDAADEIERLRKEVWELKGKLNAKSD